MSSGRYVPRRRAEPAHAADGEDAAADAHRYAHQQE